MYSFTDILIHIRRFRSSISPSVGLHVMPDCVLFEAEITPNLDVRHHIFRPAANAGINPSQGDLELASNIFRSKKAGIVRFRNIRVVDNSFFTQAASPSVCFHSNCEILAWLRFPRNRPASRTCVTPLMCHPKSWMRVASADTGSSANKTVARYFGVPLRGPSPCIPTIPSAITKCGRTVAHMSRMLSSIPAQ